MPLTAVIPEGPFEVAEGERILIPLAFEGTEGEISYSYEVVVGDGTASAEDFGNSIGSGSIAVDGTEPAPRDIPVRALVDAEDEGDETFFLQIELAIGTFEDGSTEALVPITILDAVEPGGPILGTADDDSLVGTGDDDVIRGLAGDDDLSGRAGADLVSGGAGDDVIGGGRGADLLKGGGADDALAGGFGRDMLAGGRGDDILSGGGGRDTFVFRMNQGEDTVSDFRDGRDLIAVRGGDLGFDDLVVEALGEDTLVTIGQTEVTLSGVDAGSVTEADFLFV
jgi:Ca2+-binding RTX toxin-like protein